MAFSSYSTNYKYADETTCNAYEYDSSSTIQKRGSIVLLNLKEIKISHGFAEGTSTTMLGQRSYVANTYFLIYKNNTDYLLLKLPSGFAPAHDVYIPATVNQTNDCVCVLKADGCLYLRPINCSANQSATDPTGKTQTTIPAGLRSIPSISWSQSAFDSHFTASESNYPYIKQIQCIYQIGA